MPQWHFSMPFLWSFFYTNLGLFYVLYLYSLYAEWSWVAVQQYRPIVLPIYERGMRCENWCRVWLSACTDDLRRHRVGLDDVSRSNFAFVIVNQQMALHVCRPCRDLSHHPCWPHQTTRRAEYRATGRWGGEKGATKQSILHPVAISAISYNHWKILLRDWNMANMHASCQLCRVFISNVFFKFRHGVYICIENLLSL